MVEDIEFVRDGNTGTFEILQRPHDLTVLHVSANIVVSAHRDNAGMVAAGSLDDAVEDEEIIMIPCQQDQNLLNSVEKVPRIHGPSEPRRRRLDHKVSGPAQPVR